MGKILLVDDEPTYCQHIAFLLAGAGHDVRTAANSHDAVLVGFEFLPDLIITDWALRDQYCGGEIAAVLLRVNARMRTVFISGNPEVVREISGGHWAFDEVISKPFNRARILAAVERLVPLIPKLASAVTS